MRTRLRGVHAALWCAWANVLFAPPVNLAYRRIKSAVGDKPDNCLHTLGRHTIITENPQKQGRSLNRAPFIICLTCAANHYLEYPPRNFQPEL